MRYVQEATIAVAQVASALWQPTNDCVNHDVYAFVRAHLDDRVVAIFNRGKTDAKVDMNVSPELNDGDYADALTGKSVQVKDGKMEFTLPAQTAAFLTRMK